MTTHKARILLAGGILLLMAAQLGAAQSESQTKSSPADLVKDVIYNELHPPANSDVHWRYRLDKQGDGKQETRVVVETNKGSIDKLIRIAGKPLSDAQESVEESRILRYSRNAEEQRKAEQGRRKDAEQCDAIMKMIPAAFVFEQVGSKGDLLKLSFKPAPGFKPPSREGKVLQQMAGEMWLDARQKRLVSINGQLMNEVKFGGGLLGHLEKGGAFSVKRAEIAPADWEMTELTVNMQGKALLFKSISVQQKELHSNFERVPDDLTLADAASLLMRQTLVAAKQQ